MTVLEPEPEAGVDKGASNAVSQNSFVITVHGPNAPGLLYPLMQVLERPEYQIGVRDMAQYVIERSLVFSIMLEHGFDSSISLIKELVTTARTLQLELDFSFGSRRLTTKTEDAHQSRHIVAINVTCSVSPFPVPMLHGLFVYLADNECKVLEIVHQRDDRIGFNNECSKITLRVQCPAKVRIAKLYLELQEMCWRHQSEVTVREWEGLDRPNGKSLVLFGLSEVLCPYDVLDMVLREAGVDPSSVACSEPSNPGSIAKAKVQALAGKDASCLSRAVDKLEFTPGAYFLCQSLKALGFRLAVLSNTGCKVIVQKVKKELNLDYAISRDVEVGEDNLFTGHYAGDHKEEAFNKVDYLQLMAEKEGVHPRNIIIVGQFLKGMSKGSVQYLLDTYGPMIFFKAPKMPSFTLTTVLYLLGFSGMDVEELREMSMRRQKQNEVMIPEAKKTMAASKRSAIWYPEGTRRFLVRVRSERNDVRSFAALLLPLCPYYESGEVKVRRIQQVTLASENVLLGMELAINRPDPHALLKDLLFEIHKLGFIVNWSEKEGEQAPIRRNLQCIVTIVERPKLSLKTISAFFKVSRETGVDIVRLERLSEDVLSALQIVAIVPQDLDRKVREQLLKISKELDVDIAFQRDGIERWNRRMVVFDMDSTLVQQEVIDELAKQVGVEANVKDIIARAMRGELDFHEAFSEKVALFKGQPAKELFDPLIRNLTYTTGAWQLCRTLKRLGYKMAVISGGFVPVAREVQKALGLDYAFANTLETRHVDGVLTGHTIGPVVTPQRKRALLSMIAQVEGCDLAQTIAVGDGSNDIPMLITAGLGVAFCAKPKVQAAADFRLNSKDLSTVLFLIGLSQAAQRRLLERHAADDAWAVEVQMSRLTDRKSVV